MSESTLTPPVEMPEKRRRPFSIEQWIKDKMPLVIVTTLFTLIVVAFFFNSILVTIHPGEAGVLYRRLTTGTQTDYIYPEKLHFVLPWNTMYVYSVRVQTIRHELTVLTKKGLPVTLYLAIRFRPEYDMLGVLHKNVGPDYVDRILVPQIESVLRKNIGQLNPEDVYTNKEGILTNILLLAIEETMRHFIVVEDIIITKLDLPEDIRLAIEKKLVEEQTLQKYDFTIEVAKKEAVRKQIEAEGIKNYQEIVTETLSDKLIRWQGIQATLELSTSNNAKVVVIGAGEEGLPIILGNQ
ncbi:prohibitin family protein [Ectothiorhodospiraceae bacterium BW-2]|nr:prohibitin family protein [Ectothiorhodospiraceae bacterium BW-2]